MTPRVVVAGGGLAGIVASLRALELGAHVTLLEKGPGPGGSFLFSSGFVWSYTDMPTYRREAPNGDAALQKLILDRLEAGLGWLENLGAPVLTRDTGNPLTFGARLDPERTVAVLMGRIAGLGGRVLTGTALDGLVESRGDDGDVPDPVDPSAWGAPSPAFPDSRLPTPDSRITDAASPQHGSGTASVHVVSHGERRTEADAVILASGGFAANPELVGRHIIRGPGEMLLRAHPRSTGDGFLAALEAGALESAGLDEFYGRNLPAPPARFSPKQWVEVSQLYGLHAVAINRSGQRFADEAADWSETALVRATARQPGLRAWYLLDATGLEQRVRERKVVEMVAAAERAGGAVLRADIVEELADGLAKRDVPRERVLRTLREFNAAVADERGGSLSPPRSEPAAPLRVPPFVAVEVAPAITHTVGGLATDTDCRVLRQADRRPIPGLYAAGVEVGGVSAGGYTSGLASALVFGQVAAEAATRCGGVGNRES